MQILVVIHCAFHWTCQTHGCNIYWRDLRQPSPSRCESSKIANWMYNNQCVYKLMINHFISQFSFDSVTAVRYLHSVHSVSIFAFCFITNSNTIMLPFSMYGRILNNYITKECKLNLAKDWSVKQKNVTLCYKLAFAFSDILKWWWVLS